MAVNQLQPGTINSQLANMLVQFNSTLIYQYATFCQEVITIGTAGLQAAPYNYSSGDATDIFNACQDVNNLILVLQGLGYVTFGATVNSGTFHANDGTHFGYPFLINLKKVGGQGF